MNRENNKSTAVGYWLVTILLSTGMFLGGLAQLLRYKINVDGIVRLGYPPYMLTILGIWKLLGVIVLLVPGFLLLKEWAYAGFFFLLTGAVTSHIVSGDHFYQWIAPFVFAGLTVVSWYLRPSPRRLL